MTERNEVVLWLGSLVGLEEAFSEEVVVVLLVWSVEVGSAVGSEGSGAVGCGGVLGTVLGFWVNVFFRRAPSEVASLTWWSNFSASEEVRVELEDSSAGASGGGYVPSSGWLVGRSSVGGWPCRWEEK